MKPELHDEVQGQIVAGNVNSVGTGTGPSGTWRLDAEDAAPDSAGTLDAWCLIMTAFKPPFGDLDGDACIGRNDRALLLTAVQAGTTVSATQDVNHDGVVNRADTRALMQMYTHPPTGVCP